MSKKSILLVSSAFYPEISPRSFRATELAKEFCRQGHQVTVFSKFRDHDYTDFLKEFPVDFRMWDKPRYPRVPASRKMPFSMFSKVFSRVLSILFEYPGIEEMTQVKKMLRLEGGYDLLISFAVPFPVHWGVARARSHKHPIAGTWVADCGDPFMFARLDRFKKPFYFKTHELRFCRKCSYLTVPFEDMRNQFYPQFKSKIKVIPQGFNFDEIVLHADQPENSVPVFVFAGSVIPGKRDLVLLLDYLSTLADDFIFIIYTNQKDLFKKYLDNLGSKLQLRDYIDRLSLLYEMSKADFLVNVDSILDSSSNIEAIPSKLIDYVLSNRPIININSSKLDEELVLEFMNKDYSRQRVIDKSAYDIKKVAVEFIDLIEED